MKILQIIQRSQLRGAEVFACQLSQALQDMGHEVEILVLFGEKTSVLHYNLKFTFLQANEKRRWWDVKGYKKIAQIISAGNYDVVQANAGDTIKYASLSKKIFHWKSILVFRNANKISDFINTSYKKILYKWLLKEVGFVASVSAACKVDFVKIFPAFTTKIDHLPIGVLIEGVSNMPLTSNLDDDGAALKLLHVGSFVPEKNHKGLIRIFSNLLKTFPDLKLFLVGEGKLKKEIEHIVVEEGIAGNVIFLGRRKDVLAIMKNCDVLVLPSLIEGLPGVILEAFIQKIPVVAYNVGGIKEVVINQQTGWLVNKNDEISFAATITQILAGSTQSIVQNAYDLVVREYTINQIAARFLNSYQKLVSS